MFYFIYYGSLIILVPGLILSIIAQIKIKTSYSKYSKVQSRSGWTANEMSQMFVEKYDMNGVVVRPDRNTRATF